MPRGDRTGPEGMGSMTGRGAGFCSGSGAPGYMNSYRGRGAGYGHGFGYGVRISAGYGRGMGRGAGHTYSPGFERGYAYAPVAPMTLEAEKNSLEREAAFIEEELKAIRKRLDELGTKAAD